MPKMIIKIQFLVAICIILSFVFFYFWYLTIDKFLSKNIVNTSPNILLVESWTEGEVFRVAAETYKKNNAPLVVICGIQQQNHTFEMDRKKELLYKWGVPQDSIVMLIDFGNAYHNTMKSAKMFRHWLKTEGLLQVSRTTIFTSGAHARKTFVVYSRVLGKMTKLGMTSVPVGYGKKGGATRVFRKIRYLLKQSFGWIYAMIWPL